jgi:beta-lactamase class A
MKFGRRALFALSAAICLGAWPGRAFASDFGPLAALRSQLQSESRFASGQVGIAVRDLATGYTSGLNLDAVMPAASTIKVPVMVEVFRQMNAGRFDLQTQVTLQAHDRDWGSGDLCDATPGTSYGVAALLRVMIDESDNTATNMLIRLVGRDHVNLTMKELGLHHTFLRTDVRTDTENVRFALRTTAHDMVSLLEKMAREQLIDPWSSREMIAILTKQQHNGLIPAPLPPGTEIAHKTGSLHDTLNDVGIVYQDREPYVIAVMTTHWSSLDRGRAFIHRVSKLTYRTLATFARWRELEGIPGFKPSGMEPIDALAAPAAAPAASEAAPVPPALTPATMPDTQPDPA